MSKVHVSIANLVVEKMRDSFRELKMSGKFLSFFFFNYLWL